MNSTNCVTLLTPAGVGALAVVRVAGPEVAPFLARHFSRPTREGRCVHGQLTDRAVVIDDPVVTLAPGGAFADISLHGGPWVVQRTLDLAARSGFVASNAAATVDAETQLEAEMLAALPAARTELALRTLLAQPGNWQRLRERPDADSLQRALVDRTLHNLLRLPRVAIIGVPNAGKSTLANGLFGVDRSITADLPGTTRDWVGEVADIDGLAVMLLDTPGLRDTTDSIEHRAIALASGQITSADLVVVVLDSTQAFAPDQATIIDRYPTAIVVLNKADQPCAWRSVVRVDLETQARTGQGVVHLKHLIAGRFDCVDVDLGRARCWTGRQRAVVENARINPGALSEIG